MTSTDVKIGAKLSGKVTYVKPISAIVALDGQLGGDAIGARRREVLTAAAPS